VFTGKGSAQWDDQVKYVNGKTVSESLWNFAFELNDPEELSKEHAFEAMLWEKEERAKEHGVLP
jgi:hypothetical protein